MDRIALALTCVAVLAGGTAVARWRELDRVVADTAAGERRLAALEQEFRRLQRLPRDPGRPGPLAEAWRALVRTVETEGGPFRAAIRPPQGYRSPQVGGLRGQPVEIAVEPASPLAALEWLGAVAARHPVVLTGASLTGTRLVVRGVVVGR